MPKKIFVINLGSTSTKLAIFEDEKLIVKEEITVDSETAAQFHSALDQLDMRYESACGFIEKNGCKPTDFDIIVARGGSLPPMPGGAFAINDLMINEMIHAPYVQHASNLACMIARRLADPYGIPSIIYDAPGTDEFDPMAKITGLPEVTIVPVSHILNTRKVARVVAIGMGREYEDCRFIVAHLGGGISINVHKDGKVIDSVFDDMGPMSPQRAGRIPTRFMTALCYSGKYTEREMRRKLVSDGGVAAHLGTHDLREVIEMINKGDEQALLIFSTMAYQIAKGIGELAAVLCGQIDRIILTGGGAHSKLLTDLIAERVGFLAKIEIVPGEMEMEALAEGGRRVLSGVEKAKTYTVLPAGFETEEEFNKAFGIG